MRYQKALVIHNPVSGRGRGEALSREMATLLEQAGLEIVVEPTLPERSADDLVRIGLQAGCDVVAVVGGDGTLRACLRPLMGSGVPVLLVPGGTSNLVAAHLGLPTRPRALVKLLDDGVVRAVDVAQIDGDPFVLAAGFGLATDVIRDADAELKRYLGPIAYLWSLIRNLARQRVRVEMRLDDGRRVRHKAKLVLFANCAETLAQVDLVPDSAIDDGVVDVAVFHYASVWEFLRLIGLMVTARWRRTREAVFYRTESAEVWIRPPMPIQIDGDVFPARSYFRIDMQAKSLQMLAPKPKAPLIPREWVAEAERRLDLLRAGSQQTPAEILRGVWDEHVAPSLRPLTEVVPGGGAEPDDEGGPPPDPSSPDLPPETGQHPPGSGITPDPRGGQPRSNAEKADATQEP